MKSATSTDRCAHPRPTDDDMGAAFRRGDQTWLHADKPPAMTCQLSNGHEGAHQCEQYTESGPFAMHSTYSWE